MRCRRPSPVTAGGDYVTDFDAIFTDEVFIVGTCSSSSSSAVVVAMAHWPKALATGEATGRLGLAGLAGRLGRAAWQGQRKGSWLKILFFVCFENEVSELV